MILQPAQRKRAKIKMALQGPSGSGKTYSALQVAFGLCEDWSKIAVVDTENHSADLYADLGSFSTINLTPPHTPERYVEALELCERAGMEVVILDSVTHEWENLLEYHSSLPGNSFTNWAKVTPRHNAFVQKVLQSPLHVLCTIRTKQDYVLNDKNGRLVPQKVGLKSVQRDGLDYEFTLVFDLDSKNLASCSKDRTGLFYGQPEHKLSAETGKAIRHWCESGTAVTITDISQRILDTKTITELMDLYRAFPQFAGTLKPEFEDRKRKLLLSSNVMSGFVHQKIHQNGTAN